MQLLLSGAARIAQEVPPRIRVKSRRHVSDHHRQARDDRAQGHGRLAALARLRRGGRRASRRRLGGGRRDRDGRRAFGALPATLTVPGGVASWCAAHEEYGRLPLARDLAAAVGYAHEGFPVTGRLARAIELHAADSSLNAYALAIFTARGAAPRAGDKLANRGLALVLERIAAAGREGFYAGDTARSLASFARAGGGFFDEADFRAQQASWAEPLSATYRGIEIFETPPPTQGFTVLEMLNLIEPYEIGKMDPLGPELAHLLVQAKQIAYHDRDRLLADPE